MASISCLSSSFKRHSWAFDVTERVPNDPNVLAGAGRPQRDGDHPPNQETQNQDRHEGDHQFFAFAAALLHEYWQHMKCPNTL